ncbi:hypothetical protein [Thalassobius sp. MITS945101]|uniref:hypothetical protein n=1 Tax=Thalassobius sp. MITS945101 TaxID=3096994 RepID=UPI00399BEB39
MWLSKRRHFLSIFAVAALSGCGFTPVYGPAGDGHRLQDAVLAAEPKTRDDQQLLQQIEARIGRSANPEFDLTYTFTVQEERVAVSANNITTRFNLIGQVDYALKETVTGITVTKGTAQHFTGYSSSGTTAATLAAERDARARLAVILGDQIVAQLLAKAADLDG